MVPANVFDLADFGDIYIEVRDVSRFGRKSCGVARNTIIKTSADGDQEVAVLHSIIGRCNTVHAQHMQRQGVGCVTGAERHQCRRDRDSVGIRQVTHRLGRIAVYYAAARIDQRALGFREHGKETLTRVVTQAILVDGLQAISVTVQRQCAEALERTFRVLHVFWNIDHNRTRPAGAGKFERTAHRLFKLFGVGDQEYVFCDGAHDCRHGRFLKRIRAHRSSRHLPAYDDDWNRVSHAITNGCHGIRCTWSRRHHDDTDFAARACITCRHETGTLLICWNDQRHRRLAIGMTVLVVVAEYRVVRWQDRAATVAEYGIDTFIGKDLHDDIGAAQSRSGERMCRPAFSAGLIAH